MKANRAQLRRNLANLRPILHELGDAEDSLTGFLAGLTFPFPLEGLIKSAKGDYLNLFLTVDITTTAITRDLLGGISPLVADELAEVERQYPPEWLEAAFREAAAQNARSWRYVSRILERWAVEGPDYAKTARDPAEGGDRYFSGKYGRILKQRLKP